jgi:hypothetical protein
VSMAASSVSRLLLPGEQLTQAVDYGLE